MKYLMTLLVSICISFAAVAEGMDHMAAGAGSHNNMLLAQAAQPAEPDAPAKAAGSAVPAGSATASQRATPAVSVITPEQLMSEVKAAYADITSYTVDFVLIQQGPRSAKKKMTETRMKKLENLYTLMYKGPSDMSSTDYWLRLDAKSGYHNKTVVIREKNEKGKFQFRVYKPAFPNGTVVDDGDKRIADVSKTRIQYFIDDLERHIAEQGSEATIQFVPEKIILEVTYSEKRNSRDTTFKTTTYFDQKTKHILKQETRMKIKDKFYFYMLIKWGEFVANPELSVADFTKKPDYTEE